MPQSEIFIKGARENNLKNIDVTIPRDKLVVITGLSGSGKSSLAFDTIYAEGQRRYVESLSAYARQFLGRMHKPDVDFIEGLSPAISIDQKGTSHNPRSIVGTVTEIFDYLRLLFARVGKPHCPACMRPITRQTVEQIVDAVQALPIGTRFMVLAPRVRHKKGEHLAILEDLRKGGFVRARVNGEVRDLADEIALDKQKWHDIEAVVDRLAITENDADARTRLADSVETALKLGEGVAVISIVDGEELVFSENMACTEHGAVGLPEIEPRTFSFNSPHGACTACTGLGFRLEVDPEYVVPNPSLSIAEGAVQPWARAGTMSRWYGSILAAVARKYGFSTERPFGKLTKREREIILYGTGGEQINVRHVAKNGRVFDYPQTFDGVIPSLDRRYRDTESDYVRGEITRYMTAHPCVKCDGKRLRPEALSVLVGKHNVMQVTALSITQAKIWIGSLEGRDGGKAVLSQRDQIIASQIVKEIDSRLQFLLDIGLDYLTLDRPSGSLSGGEAQRIRLATQIGSGLMGVLYVCDEPSIGLHAADQDRLIKTLMRLRDVGNTIIVVEHDEAIMRAADWIVDLGPGAGEDGGYVVACGPVEVIENTPESITGQYLSGRRSIPLPTAYRAGNGKAIKIKGARENNLKNISTEIPLGKLVCVTGVSGSGKSTLINEVLYKKLAQVFYRARDRAGAADAITGLENIDKVVDIDQSPIGRTPRSNPATYTGAFTPIRELFASVPEARARGYTPGRFSFNVKGGRCEACAGEGYVRIEMQFLPDVTVPCEVCEGKRYNREALEILFKGKNIAEVLNMTVAEAQEFFANIPKVNSKLSTMREVGLGYIRLGQPATTLSGGEAQRVKLSTELSKRSTSNTFYILDEPTTGLSFEDAYALLKVLHR
ncbi:MAG: excinuclease ABC subunit UvrA, partial [Chloroflexi bacterium]|nr:excinuclease ABC subunit UvrA [Chloroflexota bacterium]